MKQHLKTFANKNEYTVWEHSMDYIEPYVVNIVDEQKTIYTDTEKSPYELQPFTYTMTRWDSSNPNWMRLRIKFQSNFTFDGKSFYQKISIDGGKTWEVSTSYDTHFTTRIYLNMPVQVVSNGRIYAMDVMSDDNYNYGGNGDSLSTWSGNILSLGGGDQMYIDFNNDKNKQYAPIWSFDQYAAGKVDNMENLYIPQEPYINGSNPAYKDMFKKYSNLEKGPHMYIKEATYKTEAGSGGWESKGVLPNTFAENYTTTNKSIDLRNIVIDIPDNMRVDSPAFCLFLTNTKCSYLPTFVNKHITTTDRYVLASAFQKLKGITELPKEIVWHHTGNFDKFFDETDFVDLSKLTIYNGEFGGSTSQTALRTAASLEKSPKFYTPGNKFNGYYGVFTVTNILTDVYLLGTSIPQNMQINKSTTTIHYGPWCNNLSTAQSSYYPNATFEEYTDAEFFVTQKITAIYDNDTITIDSDSYKCNKLELDDTFLSRSLWNSNADLQALTGNEWFTNNTDTITTHVIYKNELLPVTYITTQDGAYIFSFTDGTDTYKFALEHFYHQSANNWFVYLPSDIYYRDIYIILSYNGNTDEMNIKYIN